MRINLIIILKYAFNILQLDHFDIHKVASTWMLYMYLEYREINKLNHATHYYNTQLSKFTYLLSRDIPILTI